MPDFVAADPKVRPDCLVAIVLLNTICFSIYGLLFTFFFEILRKDLSFSEIFLSLN